MVIFGSGEGETMVGRLAGTVVVVGKSAGEKLVVVFFGTGSGSTEVEGSTGTIVE